MRLLISTSHRNVVGGVERYLQAVLPCLVERGHELAVLYEFRFDPNQERIDPIELGLPCCGIQESGIETGLRFARDWKPDVVYSQGLQNAHLQSALVSEFPTVLFAHNYVGACASEQKCHAFPHPQPCDRLFGPACLALYFPRRCGGLNPITMWKVFRHSADNNALLADYAAILVASSHMRREYQRHGVKPERIHLAALPNPNETEKFPATARASRNNLLFLGRLTRLKGAAELLRAIPLAERQLGRALAATIAGDGPARDRLQDFSAQNGLNVQFPGWIRGAQKADLIAKSDLLVVPSLWPEPFGLVGIEAGAYGLPAVAYDVGGISDWLIPGYSGELAPGQPPTVEGLADAICRALADPVHYADLCRGAREVASRFTLAAHVSMLESTLESVLSATGRVRASGARGEEAVHAPA